MKKMIDYLKLLLVIGMITIPVLLMAQPSEPGDSTNNTGDVPTPFDGGVSLLVAAGVAYGLKKVHEKKKAEKDIKL